MILRVWESRFEARDSGLQGEEETIGRVPSGIASGPEGSVVLEEISETTG